MADVGGRRGGGCHHPTVVRNGRVVSAGDHARRAG